MAFQASIFTEDPKTAFDAAERLAASAPMANNHAAFEPAGCRSLATASLADGFGGIPSTMWEMTEQRMIVFDK